MPTERVYAGAWRGSVHVHCTVREFLFVHIIICTTPVHVHVRVHIHVHVRYELVVNSLQVHVVGSPQVTGFNYYTQTRRSGPARIHLGVLSLNFARASWNA